MGQLGGQRPQLDSSPAEAAEPAANGGRGQAQHRRDATVTQPGRPGQECRTNDLDEIEAAEQCGRRDQDVRRSARPAARPTEAQAPATVGAAQLALAREPPWPEHTVGAQRAPQAPIQELRLDLHGSVSDCKHAQILANTSEILPRRRCRREGSSRVADGRAPRRLVASLAAEVVVTMNVVPGQFVKQNEWRSTSSCQRGKRERVHLPRFTAGHVELATEPVTG